MTRINNETTIEEGMWVKEENSYYPQQITFCYSGGGFFEIFPLGGRIKYLVLKSNYFLLSTREACDIMLRHANLISHPSSIVTLDKHLQSGDDGTYYEKDLNMGFKLIFRNKTWYLSFLDMKVRLDIPLEIKNRKLVYIFDSEKKDKTK